MFGADEIEVPAGISADSADFEAYATCVDECDSCESNCLDRVHYQKAIADENKNVCYTIKSISLQEDCVQTLLVTEAVLQLNRDKCSQLIGEVIQTTCLVHVNAEIAVQSGTVEKCVESPDIKRCQHIFYRDMAVLNNDVTYCDNIVEEQTKDLCYEIVDIAS